MAGRLSATPENDIDLHRLVVHGQLFELYDQMLGEVDIVQVLHRTTQVVRQVLKAERATTYLVRPDTQELVSSAIIGNVSRTIRVPIREDSLAGYCALTGRSFVIPDAYGNLSCIDAKLRFDRSWDERNQFRTRDVMCAPAIFKGELMGVVQVINRRPRPFSETHLLPLQSVSHFVAYALYHAKVRDELASLKCLEKEKAEFMRILVHELRAPVGASKSLAAALRYVNQGDENLDSVLGRIEARMDELLSLVNDILDLSQIKAGRPLGDIAVHDLVVKTRTDCEPYLDEATAKGLSLHLDLPLSPVLVRIDLQAYHLILSNLISNAIKYTPAGSIQVLLHKQTPWAVLKVKDTGIGIPAAQIDRIFAEFFRASNARRSQIPGTGVGLTGVKELVERFEGELEFVSEENQGSTFTVRLPLFDRED
ncbi:MAG: GAF domain-containing sensor histidine kinase [Anaerolineae bacterium]|jgi:signal transduction histidine kinase